MKVADVVIVPRGLSRSQAAAYVGIGTTLFDRLVTAGKMPHPREIGGRRIWDRHEVDMAFDDLPRLGEAEPAQNPWDVAFGFVSPAGDRR
ncbi:helix-turn-helix transcriptional regulator [Aurantimonas endophytica]|uniref:Putative DNA-binding transcriptional regulator AlpA n=1 Tax=Aurantimonas endophytica TaxID=1522175 RepID=A0A7W6HAJ6_9HYPH|nr:XRE family transcriptional regulator [Aurantimonas endophytica]MBB4001626.1 putative DNA-binding transcriptional regulator AlpA [Aurantimonas endophytica]MCO6402737.1 XRE family transcriptional regulator [Aurantimonas endophytica]